MVASTLCHSQVLEMRYKSFFFAVFLWFYRVDSNVVGNIEPMVSALCMRFYLYRVEHLCVHHSFFFLFFLPIKERKGKKPQLMYSCLCRFYVTFLPFELRIPGQEWQLLLSSWLPGSNQFNCNCQMWVTIKKTKKTQQKSVKQVIGERSRPVVSLLLLSFTNM